ncbi:YadA-like family protein [Gallibacterium anatis]|uniref:YadA-like family protein n=1 Tax=Gallibacterium anatis TaxID=750 RepID=UPI0025503151|nr:YadA-like family protein [Gallibacterium anatis]WIM84672.1 YadA-like family protein [Gallibacterium anatis]
MAEATGYLSIADGHNAVASGNHSVAYGAYSSASGHESVAVGKKTAASGASAVAIGRDSTSSGVWSTAVGPGSQATKNWSTAIGGQAQANGDMSVALGAQSKVNSDDGNVVSVGNDNLKRKIINVANGVNANDAVNKSQLEAVETKVNKKVDAVETKINKKVDAVEAKVNNKVDKGTVGPNGGQAIGAGSKANGAGALALGNASEADGYIATAVGYGHALDTYTVAMGVNAFAYNANGIAIGTLAKAGASKDDYANADIFDRIDPETGKPLYNVSPGGDPRTIRSGAIAIGNGAEAVGYRNTVIGEAAKAGIIIDRDAYNHPNKFGLGAVGATAIGAAAIAGGSQATVVGNGAVAEGKLSVGMGTRSYTTGKADTAVGTYSVVTEDSAVALGAYARADHKNSVALGTSSITEDVKATASTTINGKEYTFAGGDQSQVVGTVSIGGKGVVGYTDTTDKGHWNDPAHYTNGNGRTDMDNAIYRTITNVAAGRINADSTDAINGSQLYAVMGATEENRKLIENNAINLAQTDHRINRRIDSVEEESRAGDAMNAALAALKPLQYDPNEKFQVMAGTGRFKDKQGFALGVAHHINENLLLNAGAAYSGSKYKMWNAGITYRFGSSNQKAPVIKVSNDEQRIRSLEQENMMLKQRLAAIEAKLSKLK